MDYQFTANGTSHGFVVVDVAVNKVNAGTLFLLDQEWAELKPMLTYANSYYQDNEATVSVHDVVHAYMEGT